ncbi:MAG TPA: sorbosone dehydrogenase family protein [Fimbriimonadaceae bacterium]|nr:sorbosone dehydrogenase family protein [Fimbriimonadaceae bacterium]
MVLSLVLFLLDHPGRRTYVSPNKLPPPYAGKRFLLAPKVVARPPGFLPEAPKGFHVAIWAKGLKSPRWLLVGPNGDVFCTECYQNRIELLRDEGGVAGKPILFAKGLNLPFGMAIHAGYFYIANTDSVVRFRYQPGQEHLENPKKIIPNIPSRGYNQHWTRNILFDPSGTKMYLTVGSETNKGIDPLPRAAIYRYNPDGSDPELIATGMRNPVGLAWQPGTNQLWCTCVERDYMGDDLVPDYFTRVKPGQFYGWPWYYIGKHRDPKVPLKGAPKKPITIPDDLFIAHSTPLGVLFYTGKMFPAEYRNDAFIAMRGATNRRHRSGYKVVRVRFDHGKLIPGYEDFLTGWLPNPLEKEVYGRPVGIAQLPDGSLLVSDEGGGCIWRVTYRP